MLIPKRYNGIIDRRLGKRRAELVKEGISVISNILPHIEVTKWQCIKSDIKKCTRYENKKRVGIKIKLDMGKIKNCQYTLEATIRRKKIKNFKEGRTLNDANEMKICKIAIGHINQLVNITKNQEGIIDEVKEGIQDRIVAEYLKAQLSNDTTIDFYMLIKYLKRLSEQSYENKSISFGVIIKKSNSNPLSTSHNTYFLKELINTDIKKYKMISDGYHTAFTISLTGVLTDFCELRVSSKSKRKYFPEWCGRLVAASEGGLGIALTKQGDIIVLENQGISFTYRLGKWQYWNHNYLRTILTNEARAQKVGKGQSQQVVDAMYRIALDVSFRRSGGLIVLLKNSNNRFKIVRKYDLLENSAINDIDEIFKTALPDKIPIHNIPRKVLVSLSSIDGAIVLNNKGRLLAFGAVLITGKRYEREEGSRTKAAKQASKYGMAIKVSSDGEITVYSDTIKLVQI